MAIAHNFAGLASHVAIGWLVGRTFATPYAMPFLMVLFGMHGVIEHYPEKFYVFAKANTPLAGMTLVVDIYWFYNLFSVSAAPGWMIWSGIASFIACIGLAKALDVGLPKDTIDEQIEALKINLNYDREHLMVHIVLTLILGFLSFTCPGQDMWSQPLIDVQAFLGAASQISCADVLFVLVPCLVSTAAGIAARGQLFNFLGLASHVVIGWLVGRTFAIPHAMPFLVVLFGMHGVIEHYPEKFYVFAKANTPLAGMTLAVDIYWFYKLFSVSAAPGWIIWSGIAAFIACIVLAKALDMGLPKDTIDEQIEALKVNPNYDRDHLMVHIVLTVVLGFLSFTCSVNDAPQIFLQEASNFMFCVSRHTVPSLTFGVEQGSWLSDCVSSSEVCSVSASMISGACFFCFTLAQLQTSVGSSLLNLHQVPHLDRPCLLGHEGMRSPQKGKKFA